MFGKYWSKGPKNFESLEADLKGLMIYVGERMEVEPFHGYRDRLEQDELVKKEKSKLNYPNSKHNKWPSQAVDIQIYKNGKATWEPNEYIKLWHLVMFYCMDNEINIRWGGNWDGDNTILGS